MPTSRIRPGVRVGPKAKAAKILLELGETHRTTADTLGISKGTVLALSKQQILSDTELGAIERLITEKALKVADKALDRLLEKGVLEKLNGTGLSSVVKDMRKVTEHGKPDTTLLCNTLMLNKYVVPDQFSIRPEIEEKEGPIPQHIEEGE